MGPKNLLTIEDLENGQVEVPIEFLTGEVGTVILKAPTWRERRALIIQFQQQLDPFAFVNVCLKPQFADRVEAFLNKLSPDSLARVENYAIALCCGESYQKKMEAIGMQTLNALNPETMSPANTANGFGPNSGSPAGSEAAQAASNPSEAGPGPESFSTAE